MPNDTLPGVDLDGLKACPFCGGEASWAFPESLKGHQYHGVGCRSCMFTIPRRYLDKAEAAAKWNTRAAPAEAELRAEVERLRRVLRKAALDVRGQAATLPKYFPKRRDEVSPTLAEIRQGHFNDIAARMEVALAATEEAK